ncbi:MAG: trypsin-like serine protease [Clostridiaceae bacterium]|jgi:S1-C subfamily serine protease|nr:trypsin-like serine protease [Clostridiaceae bacterium]
MHYDDKIDNDGGGTNNAGHRSAGAGKPGGEQFRNAVYNNEPTGAEVHSSEHKSPNHANYQSYTDPRRTAPDRYHAEYRWSRSVDGQTPGSIHSMNYQLYQTSDNNDKKDRHNKAGVRAVIIISAILVVLAVAAVSILGTLAYTQLKKAAPELTVETGQEEPVEPTDEEPVTKPADKQAEATSPDESQEAEPERDDLVLETAAPEQPSTTGQLQDAAEKVIPSVVLIREYRRPSMDNRTDTDQSSGSAIPNSQQISPITTRQRQDMIVGEGSGVILSADGYIVTNAHVVEGGDSYEVVLYDGVSFEADLMGADSVTDLAVLKIDPGDVELKPATFVGTSGLRVADQVIAVGNPTGSILSSSVSVGYISALNRKVMAEDGSNMNYIQTDAAINRGNSGGALANLNGEVIGINALKVAGDTYEGLGFAIPWDTAEPVVRDLVKYGKVQNRPALGVRGRYIDHQFAFYYQLASGGFLVDEVVNRDLIKAGLRQGHIITAIDDLELVSSSTLSNYLAQKKPGDEVVLHVVDNRTRRTFEVTVTLISSQSLG